MWASSIQAYGIDCLDGVGRCYAFDSTRHIRTLWQTRHTNTAVLNVCLCAQLKFNRCRDDNENTVEPADTMVNLGGKKTAKDSAPTAPTHNESEWNVEIYRKSTHRLTASTKRYEKWATEKSMLKGICLQWQMADRCGNSKKINIGKIMQKWWTKATSFTKT